MLRKFGTMRSKFGTMLRKFGIRNNASQIRNSEFGEKHTKNIIKTRSVFRQCHYSLFIIHYSLFTIHYSLLLKTRSVFRQCHYSLLSIIYYLLFYYLLPLPSATADGNYMSEPERSTLSTPESLDSLAITDFRCSTLLAAIVRFIRILPSFVPLVLIL